MAGRQEAAMEALRSARAKEQDNAGLQQIGGYLQRRLEAAPALAEALLAEGKSLDGAWTALCQEAKKRAHGRGCVVFSDAEGYAIICGYYGISPTEQAAKAAPPQTDPAAALDIDALLGM